MSGCGAGDLAILVREGTALLAAAGVASPRADAELLAGHVLGLDRGATAAAALVGRRLDEPDADRLRSLYELRAQRLPLQHLTGRAPFRTLELAVGPGVFVPRPETEVAAGLGVDEVRRVGGAGPATSGVVVVDLCAGSGALGLAVAVETGARVVSLERSPEACAWAARNVAAHPQADLELRQGDVTDAAAPGGLLADLVGDDGWGTVDVVVANPPYIPQGAEPVEREAAEHDPPMALYGGGPDGMRVPGAVVRTAAVLLRPGGLLVMEHGERQGAATRALAAAPLWTQVATVADLTGRDRVLVARRTDASGHSSRAVRTTAG